MTFAPRYADSACRIFPLYFRRSAMGQTTQWIGWLPFSFLTVIAKRTAKLPLLGFMFGQPTPSGARSHSPPQSGARALGMVRSDQVAGFWGAPEQLRGGTRPGCPLPEWGFEDKGSVLVLRVARTLHDPSRILGLAS